MSDRRVIASMKAFKRTFNLKTKLFLTILPLFLLSMGVLSGLGYFQSRQLLTGSTRETAQAMGTDYASLVEAYVQDAVVQLDSFAIIDAIKDPTDRQRLTDALSGCVQNLAYLDDLTYIFPDGSALRPDGSSLQLSDQEYFKQAAATKKPVISGIISDKSTGKTGVNVAVPVLSAGRLNGVLTGSISLDKLNDLINDPHFLTTGYGILAESSGKVISYPRLPEAAGKLNFTEKAVNPELKLKSAELDERFIRLFQTAAGGEQVAGTYQSVDDSTTFAVLTPVNLLGNQRWVMLIAAPETEMLQKASALSYAMTLGGLVCLVLAVICIYLISKHMAQPLIGLLDECTLLAQGDLRQQRSSGKLSRDEIGQLGEGFQVMRTSLRSLVTKVQSQSEQLAASSEEMTAGAQQSADAAGQVAASITEIAHKADKQSASANQIMAIAQIMSDHLQQILQTTHDISDTAETTSQSARQGLQVVEQTVQQMQAIGQNTSTSQTLIAELDQSFQSIREMVTLITSIAGQTNLLALNAAIEAARAGEQGKGFAVVAEEVRKLAEESNQAAQQINSLVEKNQINLTQVINATQTGAAGVQTGISFVRNTGETFDQIVDAIFNLSEQIKTISASIREIATGHQTLVQSIQGIDNTSRQTADEAQTVSAATEEQSASAQEIAASSQNLAALAETLHNLIAKFRL